MNANTNRLGVLPSPASYGVYLVSHYLLDDQPDRTEQALSLWVEDPSSVMACLRSGQKVLVREGRFEALNVFAARLYSQGFQIELIALD
jgi:hypothetical protein